ncbi:MAG: anhydro-N-acetylmuramic acid kinase [Gemmatimonadota bacterium]|nr:anhydro-N-acetylmuramic acid kinase [Gemmatimonadota bacterium]
MVPVLTSGADGVYVGLMSGTSLDGISAAVVRFDAAQGRMEHELLSFASTPFDALERDRLHAAMSHASAEEYCSLSFDLGARLAEAAIGALRAANVAASQVRAIGSHGQTMWHSPRHSTWQLGESAVIAERTGIDVVADFRVRDVAAGGEGAPLVPIADSLLYSSLTEWRLLQNIGGIGNVTVSPPGGELSRMRAFDTGPGVVVIDHVVRRLYPTLSYDHDGSIARTGRTDEGVVEELLRDPYFAKDPPKSTGREYFGVRFADRLLDALGPEVRSEDAVATAVALTSRSIAASITRFVGEPVSEMIVSGGGARNSTLLGAIIQDMAPLPVRHFDDVYYNGEAKESVAFALLAYLHLSRNAANVIGATGARGPRVLGKLTPA